MSEEVTQDMQTRSVTAGWKELVSCREGPALAALHERETWSGGRRPRRGSSGGHGSGGAAV